MLYLNHVLYINDLHDFAAWKHGFDYNLNEFKSIISPVSISLSSIKGKIIPPGDKIDLKIVAYYETSNNPTTKKFSYKIGLITKSR